jgi:hypothetical protein
MSHGAGVPASCDSCGVSECPLHLKEGFAELSSPGQGWFLDEKWEEFDIYLQGSQAVDPMVFIPWRSSMFPKAAYAWSLPPSAEAFATPVLTLRRSLAMRRLTPQGRRQQLLEIFDRKYAAAYAKQLPYQVARLVVWQNFLPFLYLDKTLGGREYDALLWRSPRHFLQATLTEAQLRYPESQTLRDFRSSPAIVDAERAALEGAKRIVTPHQQLGRLYPDKTILLKWSWPRKPAVKQSGSRIAFLGPTIGRRGAYVSRAALRRLARPFVAIGRNLEAEDFWRGLPMEERSFGPTCLDEIGLLLAPALTEFKPRLIMQALQRGIIVIATEGCGLPPMENLHLVDPFDDEALARKIEILRPC